MAVADQGEGPAPSPSPPRDLFLIESQDATVSNNMWHDLSVEGKPLMAE